MLTFILYSLLIHLILLTLTISTEPPEEIQKQPPGMVTQVILTQVFSSEISEILKNTYFEGHL